MKNPSMIRKGCHPNCKMSHSHGTLTVLSFSRSRSFSMGLFTFIRFSCSRNSSLFPPESMQSTLCVPHIMSDLVLNKTTLSNLPSDKCGSCQIYSSMIGKFSFISCPDHTAFLSYDKLDQHFSLESSSNR